MRVFKQKDGYLIKLEKKSDILYVNKIIKKGNKIGGWDFRSLEKGKKGEKVRVYLIIDVEKKESNIKEGCIRLLGKIVEAPEYVKKGYHSFNICIPGELKIVGRELNRVEKEILKKAEKIPHLKVLIIAMDDKEASFGELTENQLHYLFDIKNRNYKGNVENNKEYYIDVSKKIEELSQQYDYVVVASPGFYKEYVIKELKKKGIKIISSECSVTGIRGIREVVKRGVTEKIREYYILKEENEIMERFLKMLSQESDLVVYGKKEVKNALEYGGVETLIIDEDSLEELEEIIEIAQKTSTHIKIISKTNEYYYQLKGFGGVVGILRFKINNP